MQSKSENILQNELNALTQWLDGEGRAANAYVRDAVSRRMERVVESLGQLVKGSQVAALVMVDDLDLPMTVKNVLIAHGILTLGELTLMRQKEVGKFPLIGKVSLQKILAEMNKHGVRFSG